MNYLEIFDAQYGDAVSGPITVNFRHMFDRPKIRVQFKSGSVLIGEVTEFAALGGVKLVTIEPSPNEFLDIALNTDEIASISEVILGNHQVVGKTICTIYYPKTKQTFFGEAYCGREDRYNRRLGRTLSFVRAAFAAAKYKESLFKDMVLAFTARNYKVVPQNTARHFNILSEYFPEVKYVISTINNMVAKEVAIQVTEAFNKKRIV